MFEVLDDPHDLHVPGLADEEDVVALCLQVDGRLVHAGDEWAGGVDESLAGLGETMQEALRLGPQPVVLGSVAEIPASRRRRRRRRAHQRSRRSGFLWRQPHLQAPP